MNQQPFRLTPAGPASAYQTFEIKTPHGPAVERPATCEEVDCTHFLNGWQTPVPATATDLLDTIRKGPRAFQEIAGEFDGQIFFLFAPGTPCFRASQHRLPIRPDLPQIFLVKDGDWRGNPRGTPPRIHQRPDDWVEHAQEVTESVKNRIERG